jgi:hypothetical protein
MPQLSAVTKMTDSGLENRDKKETNSKPQIKTKEDKSQRANMNI